MKLLSKKDGVFLFHFEKREWTFFKDLLGLYPQLKEDYNHAGVQSTTDSEGNDDNMLREMRSEHKMEQKKWIGSFLSNKSKQEVKADGSLILKLDMEERESILEILNDIRVGSWVMLGSPVLNEGNLKEKLNEEEGLKQVAWAMDLSGYFQMGFLRPTPG